MTQQARFSVTRTDDFVFRKTGKRREPIAETYSVNISIGDSDSETGLDIDVEYPDGIAGLLSSFQPFSKLGWLLKSLAVQPAFRFALAIDHERSELQLGQLDEINQQLEHLNYLLNQGAESDERDEIKCALDFLSEEIENYLLKDVEIILTPWFLDTALFDDSFEGGYYESPGFLQADAAHVERVGDDLYLESVKGARMVQKPFGSSMRRLLDDFRSYKLNVDDSRDAHVLYLFCKLNRKSAFISLYVKLYRASSVLTDKRLSVEIRHETAGRFD